MQVDVVNLIEEMAAIYVHVEVGDDRSPDILAQWREEIEMQVKALCIETFGLQTDLVEIEVVLFEGSLWAKIKPKLVTIGLILSLYNGVHSAPDNLLSDWEKFAHRAGAVVEQVTKGTVNRVEGLWQNSEGFYQFVRGIDPTTPQHPDQE
jgi:hypothetical protein